MDKQLEQVIKDLNYRTTDEYWLEIPKFCRPDIKSSEFMNYRLGILHSLQIIKGVYGLSDEEIYTDGWAKEYMLRK